ncbi:MAG TPA: GTPase Era [Solirubrobacteraceae bacterium]|nr:GTPase Era [Solirubrobacteraceae bacterium]
MTRAGFVALAGRPNVGKSTLTNSIVGAKVAIVSDRPQTTRRAIRGVATGSDWQLVLVDLPGVQRPRDAMTQRMARRVDLELADADAALMLVNGEEGVGPGDRFIAESLRRAGRPVTLAVNKIDRLGKERQAQALLAAAEIAPPDAEVFPVSARTGEGIRALVRHLAAQLPESPFLYPSAQRSDVGREEQLSELIREQVLRRTFQELPHATSVVIEEVAADEHDGELTRVDALIWVETESQKAIVVGRGGRMIKAIGIAARRELERELDGRVHLSLIVRVRRHWRTDDGLLDRLGIE